MELRKLFALTAIASAIALTGCGGDDKKTPKPVEEQPKQEQPKQEEPKQEQPKQEQPKVEPIVNGVDANGCAVYNSVSATFTADGDCEYGTDFASKSIQITEDVTLTKLANGGVHVFDGALLIGKDCNTTEACTIDMDGPTLKVEPGATLAFTSGEAIVRIGRGAKIDAEGTFEEPITFTSANAFPRLDLVGKGPQFADWGGIQINGMGLTNQCTNDERAAKTCNAKAEGITSYFGGNDNADSSGNIKYAKIWYAGSGPRDGGEGDDLNSLTLNAVGSGSSFDFLHIHQGYDDGIEFFGGAANISHIAVTDTQDDAIDIDAGWQGNAQFIFVKHGSVKTKKEVTLIDEDTKEVSKVPAGSNIYMGNNGFETDGEKNGGDAYNEAPASNPTIANVTVITTGEKSVRDQSSSQAIKFDDAIKSAYYNALLVKTDTTNGTACIEHKSDGEKNADMISFTSSVMACATEFKGEATFKSGKEPVALTDTAKADWFDNSGKSIRVGGSASVLSNDFATDTDSTAITVDAYDVSKLNSFFKQVDYIGAVSDADTSSNWYKWVDAAVKAAAQD